MDSSSKETNEEKACLKTEAIQPIWDLFEPCNSNRMRVGQGFVHAYYWIEVYGFSIPGTFCINIAWDANTRQAV